MTLHVCVCQWHVVQPCGLVVLKGVLCVLLWCQRAGGMWCWKAVGQEYDGCRCIPWQKQHKEQQSRAPGPQAQHLFVLVLPRNALIAIVFLSLAFQHHSSQFFLLSLAVQHRFLVTFRLVLCPFWAVHGPLSGDCDMSHLGDARWAALHSGHSHCASCIPSIWQQQMDNQAAQLCSCMSARVWPVRTNCNLQSSRVMCGDCGA